MSPDTRSLRFFAASCLATGVLLGAASSGPLAGPSDDVGMVLDSSVVKVIVRTNPPDLVSPWQREGINAGTGSGVIIAGKRILTNAHVVADAVSIEVKRAGMSESHPARVEFVGHDSDLALLTVDDEGFFENARALPVGEMPPAQEAVQVFGFPVGGETLSVTSGILSRIEVATYLHGFEELLLAQVDAAINSGNSGGPVIADGSIVGIAFQSLEEAENVGHMIPAPVIRHFIDDVSDGKYDGIPKLGAEFQSLESPAHRASLQMKDGQSGALVCRIDHGSPAHGVLRSRDVLMSIDGLLIGNDMTVNHAKLGRVYLSTAFQGKQVGQSVSLTVLRDGAVVELQATLTPHDFLVPGRHHQLSPDYFVFGGLVFQPLTMEYLTVFEELPSDLFDLASNQNVVTAHRSQVILIQKVLPHAVNRGFQDWEDYVVETVNDVIPRDMSHLTEIIDAGSGLWLEIETRDGSFLTISIPEARSAQQGILGAFGVAADRSPGLRRHDLTARAD